ncbi:MAG TPA: heme ABC exporter ATP-binding protein CcmA [Candidatus Polarisedimenticolia bacterium]|jgi:heme exporter protein A|nr:heme ABC exporter ATP-binding protein CcmA [Candidatus Polarisedimenticolia bacterium]
MTAGDAPLFEARSLSRRFGAVPAVERVDLTLRRGDRVLLLGRNGAGKTTLLRLAATLLRPSSGTLRHFGVETRGDERPGVRGRIGYLPHGRLLYDDLTVAENLRFHARLHGLDGAPARVAKALDETGLTVRADDPAGTLSRGLQQRLSAARAFLHRPDLLLLDEPFTGLDRPGVRRLQAMLSDRLGADGACLLATHDIPSAWPLVGRVIVLASGRVAVDRPKAGLTEEDVPGLPGMAS